MVPTYLLVLLIIINKLLWYLLISPNKLLEQSEMIMKEEYYSTNLRPSLSFIYTKNNIIHRCPNRENSYYS